MRREQHRAAQPGLPLREHRHRAAQDRQLAQQPGQRPADGGAAAVVVAVTPPRDRHPRRQVPAPGGAQHPPHPSGALRPVPRRGPIRPPSAPPPQRPAATRPLAPARPAPPTPPPRRPAPPATTTAVRHRVPQIEPGRDQQPGKRVRRDRAGRTRPQYMQPRERIAGPDVSGSTRAARRPRCRTDAATR